MLEPADVLEDLHREGCEIEVRQNKNDEYSGGAL